MEYQTSPCLLVVEVINLVWHVMIPLVNGIYWLVVDLKEQGFVVEDHPLKIYVYYKLDFKIPQSPTNNLRIMCISYRQHLGKGK